VADHRQRVWRLPLFWKIVILASVVSLVPLAFAMFMSINTATGVTEELLQKNLLQWSAQVAERVSYTLVSVDSDLDVMGELRPTEEAFVDFSLAQRRELYSNVEGKRRREAVPKYREVSFFDSCGKPLVIVLDDVAVSSPDSGWSSATWCERDDFVADALAKPGEAVVSGLVGCHFSLRRYSPAEGRLGDHFSGGIRISKAILDAQGQVKGVASLVLSQLHLVWALYSLRHSIQEERAWAMIAGREGWIYAHPKPEFTAGRDAEGGLVAGSRWDDLKAVNLFELPGEAGDSYRRLVEEGNAGRTSTSRVEEADGGRWVVTGHPIEGEIGPYSAQVPAGTVLVLYPLEEALKVTGALERNLALLIGFTLLLVVLGSALLAAHLSGSIRRLALAARGLARGERSPVDTERRDEIGDLARAFAQMRGELETSQEALLRAERLAAIGRFVSGIVHEVKNVLAGLGNYLSLLERKVDDGLRERILAPMRRALEQLDGLTVRLRELALKPRFSETDLVCVLKHAVELIEPQAARKEVALRLSLPDRVELEQADASLLGQVFLNVLINALEAAPQAGLIELSASNREGREVVVTIRDNGPGLPDVPQGRLLDPFFTTKPGGTGLGLYISASIVERHDGVFRIDNHPEGGAVVEIRLPL
jgi:signal transduction histidine kinase